MQTFKGWSLSSPPAIPCHGFAQDRRGPCSVFLRWWVSLVLVLVIIVLGITLLDQFYYILSVQVTQITSSQISVDVIHSSTLDWLYDRTARLVGFLAETAKQ